MRWTIQRIVDEWVGEGALALSEETALTLFNSVEDTFGSSWIGDCRQSSGMRGSVISLSVLRYGMLIGWIMSLDNHEKILERIRQREAGAEAESLVAGILQAGGITSRDILLEPSSSNTRFADLLATQGGERVFVEVCTAQRTDDYNTTLDLLQEIVDLMISVIPEDTSAELYLHRTPTLDEIQPLLAKMVELCASDKLQVFEATGLATIIANEDAPGCVTVRERSHYLPRLSVAKVSNSLDGHLRHAIARVPFSDSRIKQFIRKKSKQLSTRHPGVLVFQISGAPGAYSTWEKRIDECFREAYTRVSAIILIESAIAHFDQGDMWAHRARIIPNPRAEYPAPAFILESFRRFSANEKFQVCPV